MATPFCVNGEPDFDALKKLIEYVSAPGGADYLVVCGSTGEAATLTSEERNSILNVTIKINQGRLPVVYGLGGNNTAECRYQLSRTDYKGVSAILSVSPAYNKPTQAGIIAHFTSIADSSPVPVILYNVPSRTASDMSAETTLTLAAHPNIIGIKEASGNVEQCIKIAAAKPADFLLISGDDLLTLPLISIGAEGVISVLANVVPQTFSALVQAGLSGNYAAGNKILHSLLGLNPLMYQEGNPAGVKAALQIVGIGSSEVRLPLIGASASLTAAIAAELAKLDKPL